MPRKCNNHEACLTEAAKRSRNEEQDHDKTNVTYETTAHKEESQQGKHLNGTVRRKDTGIEGLSLCVSGSGGAGGGGVGFKCVGVGGGRDLKQFNNTKPHPYY